MKYLIIVLTSILFFSCYSKKENINKKHQFQHLKMLNDSLINEETKQAFNDFSKQIQTSDSSTIKIVEFDTSKPIVDGTNKPPVSRIIIAHNHKKQKNSETNKQKSFNHNKEKISKNHLELTDSIGTLQSKVISKPVKFKFGIIYIIIGIILITFLYCKTKITWIKPLKTLCLNWLALVKKHLRI